MRLKSKISSFFTLTNLDFCWLTAFGNKTMKLNYMLTEARVDLFLHTLLSTWYLQATSNGSRRKFLDDTIHSFEISSLLFGMNMKCAALTSGGWKSMWCRAVPTVTLRQMLWASTNRKTAGAPLRPLEKLPRDLRKSLDLITVINLATLRLSLWGTDSLTVRLYKKIIENTANQEHKGSLSNDCEVVQTHLWHIL